MSEQTNSKGPQAPTELWKQWYDTSAKAWVDAVESGRELYGDPIGLYRSWSKTVNEAQNMLQGSALGSMDAATIWQRWFEATIDIWRKAASTSADPFGIISKWLAMMEEVQAKLRTGEIQYADPFTFFREWYNATSETWSKLVEDYIGSEQFMETSTPLLESYASFFKTFRRANEEFFQNLQLPTRSDIARIAELVIALEEKVDQLDDTLDNSQSNDVAREAVTGIHGQLHALENKLNELPATLAQHTAVESLNQRLERVEGKIDALSPALQQNNSVEKLAQRLDTVESKLDSLLTALEKLSRQKTANTASTDNTGNAAGTGNRKVQKKATNQPAE